MKTPKKDFTIEGIRIRCFHGTALASQRPPFRQVGGLAEFHFSWIHVIVSEVGCNLKHIQSINGGDFPKQQTAISHASLHSSREFKLADDLFPSSSEGFWARQDLRRSLLENTPASPASHITYIMQDISKLPEIDLDNYLLELKNKPLEERALKYKVDRLFSISICNQSQYMGDVQDVYAWLLLCNRRVSFKELMPNEKLQKYFCGEFLIMCARHLIICRKFHLNQMMLLTQQYLAECLVFFNKHFDQLDKFPTLAALPIAVLRIDRQFYKQNAITDYPHLVVQPTHEQIIANGAFIDQLKEGDIVDALKAQMHGSRLCWSRAMVKKVTSLSVYIGYINDRPTNSRNVDKNSFQIVPLQTYTKNDYEWRLFLKPGDKVDYQMNSGWVTTEIEQIKTVTFETRVIYELKLKTNDVNDVYDVWTVSTSPKVQRPGLILNEEFGVENTLFHDTILDDFNDLILDQEKKGKHIIIRPEMMKSLLYIDLANLLDSIGGLNKILQATKQRKIGVEVCAELANFISTLHVVFHRSFSLAYLKEYSSALLNYMKNLDDNNIRNLSKERLSYILSSLKEFFAKLYSIPKKKQLIQGLQLELALRFINSDFLERKMQATIIFTDLLKQSTLHHNQAYMKTQELFEWFEKNDIIRKIFNEKSHPQLIARGTDFLQAYLMEEQNPTTKSLAALLQFSQPLLKLNNELYEYLPAKFKKELVEKISQRKGLTNKDALEIMKKFGGNELWFLQNGGQMWVEVIRTKKKRAQDIAQVFKRPFNVVLRIAEEISKCFDGRLRNEFFEALLASNYIHQVFKIQAPLAEKVKLLKLLLDNLLYLSNELFDAFVQLWETHSQCNVAEFYGLFEQVISKLEREQVKTFFSTFFEDGAKLRALNKGGFKIFRLVFIKVNELLEFIERKYTEYYSDGYPSKRERRQTLIITVNPVKLQGMNNLMLIVFQSQSSEVIEAALNFISFLFNHLAPALTESLVQFKDNFLQQCLQRLYKSQNPSQYLQIVKSILDQSEQEGNGNLPSLQSALPGQKQKLAIIDSFSVVKKKFTLQVLSNITVYELRFLLGKEVGAFLNEITLSVDKKPIDDMYNGYTIRQAKLGQPIVIQRKGKIERANLTDHHGKLTEEAKIIFEKLFKMFSTNGLMSKQQCQKYHQKCVGESSSSSAESRVEKIFQNHDADKDGNLSLKQFLEFYESACKHRESTVWNNLQTFGVRPDLKILDDLQITHVNPTILIRHLLVNDEKFMNLLFKTLQSPNQQDRKTAWGLLERLPLAKETKYNFNLENPGHLKYWLYLTDARNNQKQITKEILEKICDADAETLAVGLKSAIQVEGLDLPIFQKLIKKLNEINKKPHLSVFEQLSLDYALNLIVKCLNNEPSVQQEFVDHREKYDNLLLSGLLSASKDVRQRYSTAIWTILQNSLQRSFPIFQIMFTLLYRHFQTSTKSSLHPQFFELFSKTLELIRDKAEILQRLKLDWKTLTKSVIERFKTHKCSQERLSSPPDWVAQGFMHILSHLLDQTTAHELEQLIPYLFQTLLFPQGGTNKLKTAITRKQAYELIYTICKYNPNSLQELFRCGFRKVYKSVANIKAQTYSYLYSFYNDVRAECGYAGIRNLGCICYMIAMIQQFYMTRPLRYLMLMADDKEPECLVKKGAKEIDDNVLHQFQMMFANLQLTERQQYNPDQFCFTFKDSDGNPVNVSIQQDAQQFLNMLFDKLQKGLGRTPFKQILHSIYGGTNCNQLICSSCKNVKQREEHYFNISLEVKGFKNYDESFKKFIQGQVISDYMCDSCKQKTDTIKRTLLSELPNYLIVHLQRICFNYDKFENQKVNSRWQFPDQLNVYDYTVDKEKHKPNSQHYEYKLKGIVVHIGSAQYGHYFSYIRISETEWLEFNDERVREFDPDDIENQCFGGEHWRRENQSAYLLVYEKKIKKKIRLEFSSREEMEAMEKALELPLVEVKEQKKDDLQNQKEEKEEKEPENPPAQPKKPSILADLDIEKVPYYIPEKLVSRINKSNEQFSMSLNVSNTQFAHFVYRILSIEPPTSLRAEFLELCHECFHFKQQLDNDLSLSDWMVKRFKQLIVGSGWDFYNQAVQAWEKDIFSTERTSRAAAKNVLVAVLTDIISQQTTILSEKESSSETQQTEQPESQTQELLPKQPKESTSNRPSIIGFLDQTLKMMQTEVPKAWHRLEEYFQFWYELLKYNKILLKYAWSRSMMQRLLDFILQSQSPFRNKYRSSITMSKFSHPSFEAPLQVIGLLIQQGYELQPTQRKCLGHIGYLQKLIKHHPIHSNLIQHSCKNNPVNTQRLAYLILSMTSKFTHSDDVKPIMIVTDKFLAIDDDLRESRIQWLMGYPQLIYNQKLDSFGMSAINNIFEDHIIKYRSGLRFESFLQMLESNRQKYEHISARFVTMLMDLERQGYFNLSQYESPLIFNKDYSSWIPSFAKRYYEETRRMSGLNYLSYGDRIIELSNNREPKPREYPTYIIGATSSTLEIYKKSLDSIQITYTSYTVPLILSKATFKKNEAIPYELVSSKMGLNNGSKVLKKFPGAERFICSPPSISRNSYFYDEQEEQTAAGAEPTNPFANPIESDYIRKLTFKNTTQSALIVVVKFQKTQNVELPLCPISFQIDPKKQEYFISHKLYADQPLEDLKFEVETFERNNVDQYGKTVLTQLITYVKDDITMDVNSDEENQFSY